MTMRWVVAGLAAVVVLGAVVVVVVMYVRGHRDKGVPLSTVAVPDGCRVSEQGLQRARTTNPWHFNAVSQPNGAVRNECSWAQTEGRDGIDTRYLGFTVTKFTTEQEAVTEYRNVVAAHDDVDKDVPRARAVPGAGDEAAQLPRSLRGGLTDVDLVARKATVVVTVDYLGADQGFLTASPMPEGDGVEVAKSIAQELLARP
jgi:hypothetical protein